MSWGLIVFFGLGAVVIGLGVILLIAYNWDDIPKAGKLALVFGALAAAHGAGLWYRRYPDWRSQLGEALSALGTMVFGAGIWLIAQIYHIDEHYPNGFLIWAAGALALAWALQSVPQAIIATLLFAIWTGTETLGFSSPTGIASFVLVIGIAPLAWRTRSAFLGAILLAAMYWVLLCSAGYWGGSAAVFGNGLSLSVLLIAFAHLAEASEGAMVFRRILRFFGGLGFVFCAYLLSFQRLVHSLIYWEAEAGPGVLSVIYQWLIFSTAAIAWLWIAWQAARKNYTGVRSYEWLAPIALIYAQLLTSWFRWGGEQLIALVFNVICLGTATAWMVRGCRASNLALTVRGSLVLAAVLLARYFDLFDSLAIRGLIFVIFGGALFAEGFFYRRIKAENTEGGAAS
jgi:uncharacterized membrane protein